MSSAVLPNTSGFMTSKKRMLWVKAGEWLTRRPPRGMVTCKGPYLLAKDKESRAQERQIKWGSVSRLDQTLLQFRPDPTKWETSRHGRHSRTFQISPMCFVCLHSFKYKLTLVRPSRIFPKPDRVVNRLQETSHEAVLCTRSSGQTGLSLLFRSTSLHDWTVTERN